MGRPMYSTTEVYDSKYGSIPKLTHINFLEWREKATAALKMARCWQLVTGKALAPVEPDPTAATRWHEYHRVRQSFYDTRFNNATEIIYSSCSPHIQCCIKPDMNPQEMWKTLHEQVGDGVSEEPEIDEVMAFLLLFFFSLVLVLVVADGAYLNSL
jgi:hypothetical protein